MKKKGLVIIHSPKELHQFVWYYCNKGKKINWDVLCMPNGEKKEYIHKHCEAAGIFSNVIISDKSFFWSSIFQKIKVFLSMLFYFIIGQQKKLCRKFLNALVRLDDYDELVVACNTGIIVGSCIVLGEEKNVVILDDGLGEYQEKTKWLSIDKLRSPYYIEGLILSRMGYCSPGFYYFEAEKNCTKYSYYPEKMIYRNYKKILPLFADEGTDLELYDKLLRRVYPLLNSFNFNDAEAIFFTHPMKDYSSDYEKYVRRFEAFVSNKYSRIFIKKNPYEISSYEFDDHVVCKEIDSSIPAEVLLPYLKNLDVYILVCSSILMSTKALDLKFRIIDFEGIREENLEKGLYKYPSEKDVRYFCDNFSSGKYEIIVI